MQKKHKYSDLKYPTNIKKLLKYTLSQEEQTRLKDIYTTYENKKLNKYYEDIIKDLFILFELNSLSTKQLSEIYSVSVRSIQIWIKELGLKKKKTKIKEPLTNKKPHFNILEYKNELPEAVEDFLNYLETIKGKSKNTIIAYKTDLKLFFRVMKILKGLESPEKEIKLIDISDIDIEFIKTIKLRDLYSFLKYIDNIRLNHSHAKARKVATLKSFFNFLNLKLKVIPENPASELESPKIEKRHPIYLSLDESQHLLNSLDKNNKNYYRDYCILTLFLNCGLRLSELCSIKISKINGDILKVIGKGNKERSIYLNGSCIKAIENYINFRDSSKIAIGDRDNLFISRQNRAINKVTVENLVKKHIRNAGLMNDKYSPHKLRHTAATLMYKHGNVDIRTLQAILGHESVSTTQIYTHLDDDTLRDAVKSNPLSNIK